IGRLFERYDYLLLPSAQVFPFAKETPWPRSIEGVAMDTYHRWMEVVVPGSLSGCPVANVQAGFNAEGLPMGLQIIGPHQADFAVLQLAHAYERASRWFERQPSPLLAN
ncbi:amidase family protein, partial [Pseudomonas aeruginosa]